MLHVGQYTSDNRCFLSLFTAKNIIKSRVNILFGEDFEDSKRFERKLCVHKAISKITSSQVSEIVLLQENEI
jgi:hypothetical protein